MSTSISPPVPNNKNLKPIEQIIKNSAGLFAILYAVGFAVVSIHHGRYGIVLFEFLRAKIFAAGLLLAMFIAIPVVAASRIFGVFGLRFPNATLKVKAENWKYVKICSIPRFAVIAMGLAVAAQPLFASTYFRQDGSWAWTAIWVGALSVILLTNNLIDKAPRVMSTLNVLSGTLALFSLHKWQSRDATTYLVDETEKGYYLTQNLQEQKATFIPRDAVASVDFGRAK